MFVRDVTYGTCHEAYFEPCTIVARPCTITMSTSAAFVLSTNQSAALSVTFSASVTIGDTKWKRHRYRVYIDGAMFLGDSLYSPLCTVVLITWSTKELQVSLD